MSTTRNRILITGGCGFLGSNLAAHALKKRYSLYVLDNLSRTGSEKNLSYLASLGKFEFNRADIRDGEAVAKAIRTFRPDIIFHLAGQVAMTTSLADPFADFEINATGTLKVLEAVRSSCPACMVFYSSTNKVYGDLEQFDYTETASRYVIESRPYGFDECTPLEFHSPYGCSKGAADQYMLDYHRMYGLKTVVFRHSSMYGGNQYPTYDQGWIGWFCQQAVAWQRGKLTEPVAISGNGKQVRDVLHADDMVSLYYRAVDRIGAVEGEVFNIGGGIQNSLSLLELFARLNSLLKIELPFTCREPRKGDQKVFVADIRKAESLMQWKPLVSADDGLQRMLEWIKTI